MFDIGWSELMLIGVVALIVIGPKELPAVLRTVGRTVAKLRRMAGEFQGQFNEALREAELSEVRDDIGSIVKGAKESVTKAFPGTDAFDPLRSIREDIRATVEGTAKPAADALPPETAAAPVLPEPEPYDPLRSVREEIAAAVRKGTGSGAAAAPTGAVERAALDSVAEVPQSLVPPPEPAHVPVLDTAPDLSQNHAPDGTMPAEPTPAAPRSATGGGS